MGKSCKKKVKSDHINALRKQYDSYLEEDKKRKERNEYILGRLDNIRSASLRTRYEMTRTIQTPKILQLNDANVSQEKNSTQTTSVTTELPSIMDVTSSNNMKDNLLRQICKRYILIPKSNIVPVEPNFLLSKEDRDDTDWMSKYNILNELKKSENGPHKESLHNDHVMKLPDMAGMFNNNNKLENQETIENKNINNNVLGKDVVDNTKIQDNIHQKSQIRQNLDRNNEINQNKQKFESNTNYNEKYDEEILKDNDDVQESYKLNKNKMKNALIKVNNENYSEYTSLSEPQFLSTDLIVDKNNIIQYESNVDYTDNITSLQNTSNKAYAENNYNYAENRNKCNENIKHENNSSMNTASMHKEAHIDSQPIHHGYNKEIYLNKNQTIQEPYENPEKYTEEVILLNKESDQNYSEHRLEPTNILDTQEQTLYYPEQYADNNYDISNNQQNQDDVIEHENYYTQPIHEPNNVDEAGHVENPDSYNQESTQETTNVDYYTEEQINQNYDNNEEHIKQNYEKNVEQINQNYENNDEQMNQHYENTVEQSNQNYENNEEQNNQHYENTVEQINQNYENNEEQINQHYENTVEQINQNYENNEEQINQNYENNEEQVIQNYDNNHEQTNQNYENNEEQVNQNYNNNQEQINQYYEEQINHNYENNGGQIHDHIQDEQINESYKNPQDIESTNYNNESEIIQNYGNTQDTNAYCDPEQQIGANNQPYEQNYDQQYYDDTYNNYQYEQHDDGQNENVQQIPQQNLGEEVLNEQVEELEPQTS